MKINNGYELRITTTSATGNLDYFSACVDHAVAGASFPPQLGAVIGAVDQAVIDSPSAGVTRTVNQLFIVNKDTAAAEITLYITDGANDYIVAPQITLKNKEYIIYNKEDGWKVFGRNGILKTGDGLVPVSGHKYVASKTTSAAEAAGVKQLMATFAGAFPGAWAPGTPGLSGRQVLGTEAGSMGIKNSVSGNNFITDVSVATTVASTVQVIDILWVNSGIVVTTTTAQTINSVALPPRDFEGTSNGLGVLVGIFVTAATTNAAAIANMTISYTNSDGVPGRTGTLLAPNTFPATAVIGSLVQFHLQSGDKGVRSIESITLGTTLGAGTVHLVMFTILEQVACAVANIATINKPLMNPGILLHDDAFVTFLHIPTTTSALVANVALSIMELA